MPNEFAPCPPTLKPIQHYLKIAAEHDSRDVVVAYWCRYYAIQQALKLDSTSPEALTLLKQLMGWLESKKKSNSDNEAVTNSIAAQAHIENYALKLFEHADNMDRNSVFDKSTIRSFYTAGMLMDVLLTFEDVGEEIGLKCKYAKFKAAYINNCLKNGEVPEPGSGAWEGKDPCPPPSDVSSIQPPVYPPQDPVTSFPVAPSLPPMPTAAPTPSPAATTPQETPSNSSRLPQALNGTPLDAALMAKAQKYGKWASSALNFDDIAEAVSNLRKALRILEEGQDS